MRNLHKPYQRNNDTFNLVWFVISLICLFLYAYTTSTNPFLLCIMATTWSFGKVIGFRLLLLLRELILWRATYRSYKKLLLRSINVKNVLSFCIISCVMIFFNGFMAWNYRSNIKDMLMRDNYSIMDVLYTNFTLLDIIVFTICPQTGLFQWDISSLTESYRIEEQSSFSGGSCMALGYFYGYLKLILPDLQDKIMKFQDRNRLKNEEVPEKKLFILIPSSSFIFDKLRLTDSDSIEPLEERLEPHEQHRGMVMNRVYKNTVYKIYDKNKKVKYYVPLEGASPLQTFYETCSNHKEFEEFKEEVISSFYFTLNSLLSKDKEVDGLVELIYYDDESNRNIDISEIVNSRLQYLRKLKRRKEKAA